MCNSYYWEQNWQSNMTVKNLIFNVHAHKNRIKKTQQMTGSACYKHKVTKSFRQVNYRWSNSKDTEERGKEMDEKLKLSKE